MGQGTYEGTVFRAHNPRWSWTPLSGDGARRYGGRFNPVGTPALYTSERASTALLEASPLGRPFQPLTLVAYRVRARLADAVEDTAALGIAAAELNHPTWARDMADGRVPPQHGLAARLTAEGYHGLRVRSFARGARAVDVNVVLWRWGREGADVEVIDDEGRLKRANKATAR